MEKNMVMIVNLYYFILQLSLFIIAVVTIFATILVLPSGILIFFLFVIVPSGGFLRVISDKSISQKRE